MKVLLLHFEGNFNWDSCKDIKTSFKDSTGLKGKKKNKARGKNFMKP